MAFCSKCGKELAPNSCFCSSCGQNCSATTANTIPHSQTQTASDPMQKKVTLKGFLIGLLAVIFCLVIIPTGYVKLTNGSGLSTSSSGNIKDITSSPPIAGGLTLGNYSLNDGKVKGTINTRTIARNGVYINVTTYDKNKNIIDSYGDSSPALSAGQDWSFCVWLLTEDVAYYAVTTVNYK